MGALLIIFVVDSIDIVLHGIINELFIRRVEHGRWLEIAGDTFGAFLHVLYVIVGMVAFVLRGKQLRWWLKSLHLAKEGWMKYIDKVLFVFEYYKTTEMNSALGFLFNFLFSGKLTV